jgi:hypothetical protein
MPDSSIIFWLELLSILVVAIAGLVILVWVVRRLSDLTPLARAALQTAGLAMPIATVDELLNLSSLASHLVIGGAGAVAGTLVAVHYYGPYHGPEKRARVIEKERAELGVGEFGGTSSAPD